MNNSQKVYELGQSIWYDNIQRSLLENGELKGMIKRGEIFGVTSNPSIFKKAIAHTKDYDEAMVPLAKAGLNAMDAYETLAIEDIQAAADLFLPVYKKTNKKDGYVSLEVDPTLAYETDETIEQALRLWKAVNRPNLMIKIPATKEGLPAVQEVISQGINVNVTLIFSVSRYKKVMKAFIKGLEKRAEEGMPVDGIASVASFFISRMDSLVDTMLDGVSGSGKGLNPDKLKGKAAVANGKLAYKKFEEVFSSERWQALQEKGAMKQRPLWASTSTKNPDYPDTLYMDDLIAPESVNTTPPETLVAFLDHGKTEVSIFNEADEAVELLRDIETLGISIKQVTDQLEVVGVKSFASAFEDLMASVDGKLKTLK